MQSATVTTKVSAPLHLLLSLLVGLVLVLPRLAFGLQIDGASNASPGNPVEDRLVLPAAPKPVARPSLQPLKDKLALQQEIDNLLQIANKSKPAAGRNGSTTPLSQRQAGTAAWVLGLLSMNGLGMEQDYAQAQLRFKQAQQLGEPLAAAGLAWCAIQGCDGLPSVHEARYWVAQLRATRPGRAFFLDWYIENTFSPLQANSAASAIEQEKAIAVRKQLLLNAAKTKDTQALIELGFEAVASERLKDAQTYFLAAAPSSAIAASNASLVQRRQTDQKALCQVANTADLTDVALLSSAQALHRGDNCPVNYIEAIRLYNTAANKGNVNAKRMLSLIYSKPQANGNINIAWMQQLAQINVTNMSTNLEGGSLVPMLHREPSPLFDLIPQNLRVLSHINGK
jgi:uncharacterized protein